ncbi:phosphoglycerate mutase family protein [Cystoisospora suis]|uniref:Phosphoglycerate mutase family protein n=1 Tax=Cystoisospora suis TaxID=483139 RepID=A0A2C6LAU6_9APIC|nr:phosphoglycerate mutase family protein [Cystoisospora suis]
MELECTARADSRVETRDGRGASRPDRGCDGHSFHSCERETSPVVPTAPCRCGASPYCFSPFVKPGQSFSPPGRSLGLPSSAGREGNCYRQRFYFVRHSQSRNNAISINDQTPSGSEPRDFHDRRESPRRHGMDLTLLSSLQSQGQRTEQVATEKSTPFSQNATDNQRCLDGRSADGTREQQGFSRVPDPPITLLGRTQAAAAAQWIESYVHQMLSRPATRQLPQNQGLAPPPEVKKIVCSPMRRAVETAAELNKVLHADVYIHPLLYEQGGIFWGPRKKQQNQASGLSELPRTSPRLGKRRFSSLPQVGHAGEGRRFEWGTRRNEDHHDNTEAKCSHFEVNRRSRSTDGRIRLSDQANSSLVRLSAVADYGTMTWEEIQQFLPNAEVIYPAGAHADLKTTEDTEVLSLACLRSSGSGSAFSCTGSAREPDHHRFGRDLARVGRKEKRQNGFSNGITSTGRGEQACQLFDCRDERGRRKKSEPWWCSGGRERLLNTVQRAREVIKLDLLLKALLFPFPSPTSPTPYLDLLMQFLLCEEARTGVPIYNLPQQAAYYPSSNCSFCCLELVTTRRWNVEPGHQGLFKGFCAAPAPVSADPKHLEPGRVDSDEDASTSTGQANMKHGQDGKRACSGSWAGEESVLQYAVTAGEEQEAGVRLEFRATQAPRLVAALIQWNTPTVEPSLSTGHTLGASVLMSV